MSGSLAVSVVLPVHNEVGAIEELLGEIEQALADVSFECVCVDDGSTDGSDDLLDELSLDRPWLRIIHLASNFGQTAAISAGINASAGRAVVLMDSDGQNDPCDVPALLRLLDDGFDVVSGWRQRRQESRARRVLSRAANALLRRMSGVDLHDTGCSLKAYRAEVLRSLTLLRDDHRFLPALAAGTGARVAEVPVRDRARTAGTSHYGYRRVPRVAIDLVGLWLQLRFTGRPLRVFTALGLVAVLGWSGLAILELLLGQTGFALMCLGVAATVLGASVALGASEEERRRQDGRPAYRVLNARARERILQ